MMKRKELTKDELLAKQLVLDKAKKELKSQFVGIDNVIDNIIDSISTWFMLPEIQEKPLIINLWGLTGVGKSSVVNKLAECLGFRNKHFRFDMGEKGTASWAVKAKLKDIYEQQNGFPIIISLDEFQHARTIQDGVEIDKSDNRTIWDLLDSGKFQVGRNLYTFQIDLYETIMNLKELLHEGLIVRNGYVSNDRLKFVKQMNLKEIYGTKNLDEKDIVFVPNELRERIKKIHKRYFDEIILIDLELNKLNGQETIDYLLNLADKANSPVTVDCSKAIIFVIGNLDEAYKMSGDFNPDISPDAFHEQSLRITIPDIKEALQDRFRNEQIARLGNNHLIYPAFSEKTFRQIIDLDLKRIMVNYKKCNNIELSFDQSIKNTIYNEGVFPTQGTRPLFTTISMMIESVLGKIMVDKILNTIKSNKVELSFRNGCLEVKYWLAGEVEYVFKRKIELTIENLRKSKKDDIQAITAVHECGHAVLLAILLKTLPESVVSSSASSNSQGFVYSKFKWDYVSKKEIVFRVAIFLGGIVAEKLIYGEENITTGSFSDIKKATNFASRVIKNCGFGELPSFVQIESMVTYRSVFDDGYKVNKQVKELIAKGESLAIEVLNKQRKLLLMMADYLSDKRSMDKDQMRTFLVKYAVDFSPCDLIETDKDGLFYRQKLKELVSQPMSPQIKTTANSSTFSLNKDSEKNA